MILSKNGNKRQGTWTGVSFVLFSCLFKSCCIQKHRVREMHTVFCRLKGLFRGVKGLGKVGDDVVDVLEADRQADQVGTDAGRF